MRGVGSLLIILGGALAAVGALILLGVRLPWLGRLPGDIQLRGKNWSVACPVATCILVSIVLTILLNIVLRLFRR